VPPIGPRPLPLSGTRTEYAAYLDRWGAGCGSPLCDAAHSVCHARGKVPCDVLFLGEAPGASEDLLGKPFVGPAGKLLDDLIRRAVEASGKGHLRLAFTNLVGCIPLGEDGRKTAEPEMADVKKCAGRLRDFVAVARPQLIVTVGALPAKWLDSVLPEREATSMNVTHPAALLRMNEVQFGLAAQRVAVQLTKAMEKL
jgi:uracil-DNA glycosylase family 4